MELIRKVIVLVAVFIVCTYNIQAQLAVSELIETMDWEWTEGEFVERYTDYVRPIEDSRNIHDKSLNYQISLVLGKTKFDSYVYVDSISHKIRELHYAISSSDKNNYYDFISESTLTELLGVPTFKNTHGTYVDKKMKKLIIWLKDSFAVRLSQSYTSFDSDNMADLVLNSIKFTFMDNEENDFRIAKWGDSIDDVMKKENKPNLLSSQDYYSFNDEIAGIKCTVLYTFVLNKLTSAAYLLKNEYSNKYNNIKDYDKLLQLLNLKYGLYYSSTRGRNSQEFDKILKEVKGIYIEREILKGNEKFVSNWYENKTNIKLEMYGEDGNIKTGIFYNSNKYNDLIKQKQEEDKAKKEEKEARQRALEYELKRQNENEEKRAAQDVLKNL